MEARFSILSFPQSFDGDRLHLRILVVPRLSTEWNGDPLHPVIAGFPNAGDTTPALDTIGLMCCCAHLGV